MGGECSRGGVSCCGVVGTVCAKREALDFLEKRKREVVREVGGVSPVGGVIAGEG